MEKPSVIHHTFVIERTYPVAPERVFAAFADPAKKRRWYALESEHQDVEAFEMDFRVGGLERACYRFKAGTPFPGALLTNHAAFHDIVTNRRVVMASTMSMADRPFSVSLTTFEFLPSPAGTDLVFTHQGAFFENSDGPERRQAGWSKLLEQLANHLSS